MPAETGVAQNAFGLLPLKISPDGRDSFKIVNPLKARELGKCREKWENCALYGHPEVCCPKPPLSVCLPTNNTVTGVYCCFSEDPNKSKCDERGLQCPYGWYQCSARFNGGCCTFGDSCSRYSCVDDGKGPKDELEAEQYYLQYGAGTDGVVNGKPGDDEDLGDYVNDGDRPGDLESQALDGVLTTRDVYTYTTTSSGLYMTTTMTITSTIKPPTEVQVVDNQTDDKSTTTLMNYAENNYHAYNTNRAFVIGLLAYLIAFLLL